jgi:hypothetical protein
LFSRSIHVVAKCLLFKGWIILYYICLPDFFHPLFCQWTHRLFSYLGYCEWCCSKQGCLNVLRRCDLISFGVCTWKYNWWAI